MDKAATEEDIVMSKTTLYTSIVNRVDFYISQYRKLATVNLLFSVFLCSFAVYVFWIAWNPHRVYSIVTTTDGRLIRPGKSYFSAGKGTYFWRMLNA